VSYVNLSSTTREAAERVLTRKQLDVFKLWMNGNGTRRIAVIMGVSEPTARAHLTRAQQKLKPYMEDAA
jgi:DNA-binding CsgD family transcriptional regulator